MAKKLIYTALITSPLIALYGIMPIYLFGSINREQLFFFTGLITINVLAHWAINIFLVLRFGHLKSIYLWIIGYFLTLFSRLPMLLFIPEMSINDTPFETPVYPIVNSFVVYIIIWVLIESFRSGDRARQLQSKMNQLTIENLEAKQQTLKNQLQPHFLFNALSVLKSLIIENTQLAEKYVLRLSDFLRYSFKNQSVNAVPLREELDFTKSYIELQAIRFIDTFNYTIDLPDSLLDRQLPLFSLQSLVENIFKHNYFNENNPMVFSITYENNRLKVWNKKVGLKLTERNGVGLKNLDKRYALLANQAIHIDDAGTHFCVTIPFLDNEDFNHRG